MNKRIICDCCGNDDEATEEWCEADALAEKQINFKGIAMEEMALVCTDCFEQIMEFHKHPPAKRFG